MDKFKSSLNTKFWRDLLSNSSSRISALSPIFAVAGFILPLLFGISVGWLGSVFIEYYVSPKRFALELSMAANIASAQSKVETADGLAVFLTANPFMISAFPVVNDAPVSAVKTEDKVEASNSFETSVLEGTFPNIGAYMRDTTKEKTEFIGVGDIFDEYKLTEVLYDRAIFQDEESNEFTKFLRFVADPSQKVANATPAPLPAALPAVDQQIVASAPGQEGVIDRAVIDNLMMNPFDEMKRFRIRPKFVGNEPVGIEVQWIQNDSVLTKLGVQKGDVMKSVNGIPMKNMGDITNAINSLMNGTRFDVEVLRGESPINLVYAVR
jgi:hypothetical protein